MTYKIWEQGGKFMVYEVSPYGDERKVKTFKTRKGAENWIAKHWERQGEGRRPFFPMWHIGCNTSKLSYCKVEYFMIYYRHSKGRKTHQTRKERNHEEHD